MTEAGLPPPVPPSRDPPIDRSRIRPSLLWVIVPAVLTVLAFGLAIVGAVANGIAGSDPDTLARTEDEFLLSAGANAASWAVSFLSGAAVALIIGLRHRSARALADTARAERLAREREGGDRP